MTQGKTTKSKVTKSKVPKKKQVRKPAGKAVVPYKKTQNRFRIGYDSNRSSNYGFSVNTEDAYDQRHKHSRDVKHDVHSRGVNPVVAAWNNAQHANQYGQLMPKKDTMEPFDAVIGLISGSTSYVVREWQINPGNSDMFPLLSQTAKLYERYNFMSLEFYVTPIVTPYTGDGKIILSCDLEGIEEGNPASAAMQENNTIHSDGMPYEAFGFQVAGVVRHEDSWFVRTTKAFPAGADPRKYDCGTLYVGTYANSGHNGTAMCELRVRGICALYDKLQESTGASVPIDIYQVGTIVSGPGFQTLTSGVTSYVEFDASSNLQGVAGSPWEVRSPAVYRCPMTSYYRVSAQVNLSCSNDALSNNLLVYVDNVPMCSIRRDGGKTVDVYAIDVVLEILEGQNISIGVTPTTIGALVSNVLGGLLTIMTV